MSGKFNVSTKEKAHFVDITSRVQAAIDESGLEDGAVIIYVPHTTAGVTINENADPTVQRDILKHLDRAVPQSGDYRHTEGNSPAHIKASMMGSSVIVPVTGGRLELGTWQGIFFCEFDGPRNRTVWIRTVSG